MATRSATPARMRFRAAVRPDDWWDVSFERVAEYVDRVEASIKRLDDNKAQQDKPRG